jgi:RNA polymerase sigma-70 factor (ECF subfamily)
VLNQTQVALFSFARGLVGEPELARDITQDAFMDAWRAATQHERPFDGANDETGIRRWLFTVTYRHAAKALRRRGLIAWESLDAERPHESGALAETPRFEDQIAEAEALRAALLTLGPQDAACFLLQVAYGFSTAEIAAIVDLHPDAVRKRLSRAKQRLRAAYCEQSPGTCAGRRS